jgi:hypothetical protein
VKVISSRLIDSFRWTTALARNIRRIGTEASIDRAKSGRTAGQEILCGGLPIYVDVIQEHRLTLLVGYCCREEVDNEDF